MAQQNEIKYIFPLLFYLLFTACKNGNSPTENMERVETAYQEHYSFLKQELMASGIDMSAVHIFLRAFKKEEVLEVWAKNGTPGGFVKILEYDFCTNSGILGPKRMEGDRQIPEGFYFIDRFNSKSKFYLSLGLNYPNASDLVLSDQEKPGSDIFIHGGCSSVGCIAITDEKIKQLYVLASEAKKYGQKEIPVHIFPFRMTDEALAENAEKHPQLLPFWKDLQKGYAVFEKTGKLPSFSVLGNGRYVFKD